MTAIPAVIQLIINTPLSSLSISRGKRISKKGRFSLSFKEWLSQTMTMGEALAVMISSIWLGFNLGSMVQNFKNKKK